AVVGAATSAHITGWQSVRSHGAAGELALPLNPAAVGPGSAGPTVESRQGGVQRIRVTFDREVTLVNPFGVTVTGRTTVGEVVQEPVSYVPALVMSSATSLDIAFAPGMLPDATCYTISLAADTVSPALGGNREVRVRSLAGDVTGDGEVNLTDVL